MTYALSIAAHERRRASLKCYGNGAIYLAAKLNRDGFRRLAYAVEDGKISAQFAVHLAATVPSEFLDRVIDRAEILGPRRPDWWDWQAVLAMPIVD
jgi:hypothetical protein